MLNTTTKNARIEE